MLVKKDIIWPGTHHGLLDNDNRALTISEDDVVVMFDSLEKMRDAGLEVPLVAEHVDGDPVAEGEGVPMTAEQRSLAEERGKLENTFGWSVLDHPETVLSDDGTGSVVFDIPDEQNADDFANGKYRYVSPDISVEGWPFDGFDTPLPIMNVAVTNHPRDLGKQKAGFETIALSHAKGHVRLASTSQGAFAPVESSKPDNQNKIAEAVSLLESEGISLSSDTTSETFVDSLITALRTRAATIAKQKAEEDEAKAEELEEMSKLTERQPNSNIQMSTRKRISRLHAAGAITDEKKEDYLVRMGSLKFSTFAEGDKAGEYDEPGAVTLLELLSEIESTPAVRMSHADTATKLEERVEKMRGKTLTPAAANRIKSRIGRIKMSMATAETSQEDGVALLDGIGESLDDLDGDGSLSGLVKPEEGEAGEGLEEQQHKEGESFYKEDAKIEHGSQEAKDKAKEINEFLGSYA